jgi:alpha-mannosidase
VSVSATGIEIPAILAENRGLLIRLFNAEGGAAESTVSLGIVPSSVELVELDGWVVRQLVTRGGPDGRYEVELALPRLGIRTLRCRMG